MKLIIIIIDKNSLFDRASIKEMGLCVSEQRRHSKLIENHLPYNANSFSLVILSGRLARIVTTGGEKLTFLTKTVAILQYLPLSSLCPFTKYWIQKASKELCTPLRGSLQASSEIPLS